MAVYGTLPEIPLPEIPGLLQDHPLGGPVALAWEHFANDVGFWLLPVAALLWLVGFTPKRLSRYRALRILLPLAMVMAWACLLLPLGDHVWQQHLGSIQELVPNYRWPFAVSLLLAIPVGFFHTGLALKNPDRWLPGWLRGLFLFVCAASAVLAGLYVGFDIKGHSEEQALIALNESWGCMGPPSSSEGLDSWPESMRWVTGSVLVWILLAAIFLVLSRWRPTSAIFSQRLPIVMGAYAAWAAWLVIPMLLFSLIGVSKPPTIATALLSQTLWLAFPVTLIYLHRLKRRGQTPSLYFAWSGAAVALVVFALVLSETPLMNHQKSAVVLVLDGLTRPELPPGMARRSFE